MQFYIHKPTSDIEMSRNVNEKKNKIGARTFFNSAPVSVHDFQSELRIIHCMKFEHKVSIYNGFIQNTYIRMVLKPGNPLFNFKFVFYVLFG